MRRHWIIVLLLVCLPFIGSCARFRVQTSVKPIQSTPPANTKVVEMPDVKVGDTWTYSTKSKLGNTEMKSIFKQSVVSVKDNEIISLMEINDERYKYYFDRHWNIVNPPVIVMKDGKEKSSFFLMPSPENYFFHFPLWEGKEWDIDLISSFGPGIAAGTKGKGSV